MRTSGLLVALTLSAAALSWWPSFALGLPPSIPLSCAVLCMCLAMALRSSSWALLWLASVIGTFGGFFVGGIIWPQDDPIAQTYIHYVAAVMAGIVMLAGIAAALITHWLNIPNQTLRRTIWGAIIVCAAFGPTSVALSPAVIPHWMARNERLAAERFTALKSAMERAVKAYRSSHISDGLALQPHYSGPPFTHSDWARIGKTFVKQDGYKYIIYRNENDGYAIAAAPVKEHVDGARWFCADESGTQGCRVKYNGSRHVCLPCTN